MTATAAKWIEIVDDIGPGFQEGAAQRDASDEFVAGHYPEMKKRGLISALIPTDLGGGGAAYSDMAALLRRLAYYDGPTALALSMHQHLVGFQVFNHMNGRPAPVLPRVAAENLVLVSTGARDWLESNGEAVKADGGFRISGRKSFASGSPIADIAVTSAPYNDPTAGWQVLHFPVPMKAEGVRLEDDWKVHGMRATGSQTIVLENVFVPEGAVSLQRPRTGFHGVFNNIIAIAIPLIAGVYLGIAERAVDTAKGVAARRSDDGTVQSALGEAISAVHIASASHRRMVELTNDLQFQPSLELSSEQLALKTGVIDQARRAVECAIESTGGIGFYRECGLERLLRDVRAGHYHPLPARQQVQFTGRIALGLDPIG